MPAGRVPRHRALQRELSAGGHGRLSAVCEAGAGPGVFPAEAAAVRQRQAARRAGRDGQSAGSAGPGPAGSRRARGAARPPRGAAPTGRARPAPPGGR